MLSLLNDIFDSLFAKSTAVAVTLLTFTLLPVSINSAFAESSEKPSLLDSTATTSLSVEQVEKRLNIQSDGLEKQQGNFIQKKYFKVLKNPFLSSGSFEISNEQFIWQTLKPVQSAIIFNSGELYFKDNLGKKKAPAQASTIAKLLRHLIAGDFEELTNSFSFYDDNTATECVMLTPKKPSMKKFIEQIKLCGESQVDEFVLYDINMNRTEISISYN